MNILKLIPCTKDHILDLSTWCNYQHEIEQWAGPNIRFPYTLQTFIEDINYHELPSYGLINQQNEMAAFGQFYERLSHCHLGRLIVSPRFRRQGIAPKLVNELSITARETLKLSALSLFVYPDNIAALTLYKNMGFIEKDYPKDIPLKNCLYLTKE